MLAGAGLEAVDDGVEAGVADLDALQSGVEQLGGRDLAAGDEIGEGDGVEVVVLGHAHGALLG